mmetsp:Transcript_51833/g.121704  ORF Transcript_51833/g.121704 Transcript_51833/m.121704 type:complete len:262 (-) Transcript_51833:883-1668(-)
MLLVEESVVEVHFLQRRQRRVVCARGVAVSEEHILQPFRDDDVGVHEVADALENSLEVVLLALAPHEHVELLIRPVAAALRLLRRVDGVLRRVQRHAHLPAAPAREPLALGVQRVEDLAVGVEHAEHLASTDVLQTEVLLRPPLRRRWVLAHFVLGADGEEEEDVVLPEPLPLLAQPPVPDPLHVEGGLREHVRRLRLAEVRLRNLHNLEVVKGEAHLGPACEGRVARVVVREARPEAEAHVLDILADLVGRFEAEEVEVA